jgi:hypothetical protein
MVNAVILSGSRLPRRSFMRRREGFRRVTLKIAYPDSSVRAGLAVSLRMTFVMRKWNAVSVQFLPLMSSATAG